MENLNKFHYDFIKIKVPNVEESKIKWHNFDEHPNLKRHYCLKQNSDLGYHKNFDMFYSKARDIIIRTSMPYLIHGHNYTYFEIEDVYDFIENLEIVLGVDLYDALVLEYEYGCYQSIKKSCSAYIDGIIGASGFKLLKSADYMKMFDVGQGIKYKVYDAVANSKIKKTFSRGNYPKGGLVKHEIKVDFKSAKTKPVPIGFFLSEQMDKFGRDILLRMIQQTQTVLHTTDIFIKAKSLTEILFVAVKIQEQIIGMHTDEYVTKIINQLDLTSSQKCKRLKSLRELEQHYYIPILEEITN